MGCNICEYSYIDCECTHDMHSAFDVGFKKAEQIAKEDADHLRAEITKLRAELTAMTAQADAEALYSDGLRAELERERELADRLALKLQWVADAPKEHASEYLKGEIRKVLTARRNK